MSARDKGKPVSEKARERAEKKLKRQEEKEKVRKLKSRPSAADAVRYNPDPDMGLSAAQVEERTDAGYVNASVEKSSRSVAQIVLSNVFTFFNIIFFILAAILLFEKSYNNLTFLVVVFVNTAIGIIQELRAKKTLDKLNLVSAPLTKVIRDGREEMANSDELVLDDIVVLEAGNQIIADAVVCDGEISVNESLVTGEADEIGKAMGDHLLSGSFVVSGRCRARLDKVGHESFASRLTVDAKRIKKKQQPGMMRSLTLLIRIIGIMLIPLAILTFLVQQSAEGATVKTSIENTAAAVIGMIPEGLYLLTSVALAVSVMRLARSRTLVHDMKCIETLARVDVICVDKTGTVTEPEMHVKDVIPLEPEEEEENSFPTSLRELVLNMNADNITMSALKEYFDDGLPYRRASALKGFSSATKYSAAAFAKGTAFLLGAPEFVLKDGYEQIRGVIESHSSLGERVLLFAEYRYEEGSAGDIFRGGSPDGVVIPLGLVTLENRVRPEAKETFRYFTEQGVTIKVISGDNPVTVSKAAEEAGIPGSDRYVDASTLNTKEKISKAVLEYNIFGRVKPEQKRQFIRALKKAGHTVAMTGDGVNDVLALKDADCSIAMASGSDAAANVSDLVLLDSDFAGMPKVVAEGRRVINNIQRSASLFLTKNIFSFFLTVILIIFRGSYPLKPAQISLVSMLMIGIPAFFLALEPNRDLVKGKFLRNVLFNAFPAALTAIIIVCWSLLFRHAFPIGEDRASTLSILLYSFVAYLMLFKVCKPMNLLHRILFGGMGVLFLGAVLLVPELFSIHPLDFGCFLVLFTLMIIAYPLNRYIEMLFASLGKLRKGVRDYVEKDIEKHGGTMPELPILNDGTDEKAPDAE